MQWMKGNSMPRYSDEKNAQLLIALLKAYGIRKVILSPGTTNIPMSGSIQSDPYFEAYSAYDERSAAYMACGLANESDEPVVLSCTGATASRNYVPGLTEAYYRKLPVLAVTSMNSTYNVGNLMAQTLDRSRIQHDIARVSVNINPVNSQVEMDHARVEICKAMTELTRHGGGPAHIQLITNYAATFSTLQLPVVRPITRVMPYDEWPALDDKRKIAVVIGAHHTFTDSQNASLDKFVKSHNAVVLASKVSGYHGEYNLQSSLVAQQLNSDNPKCAELNPDLIIHLGEISGEYETYGFLDRERYEVWRVSEDGEFRERFHELRYVFESREEDFFLQYAGEASEYHPYLEAWRDYDAEIRSRIPEFPFSNLWIAQHLSPIIPENSVLHLGILNSLRSWNNYVLDSSIETISNVGGFGIDGDMSTLLGASLAYPDKMHFIVLGDLAFFYDMNSLGNRHLGKNVRILMINNNVGTEFKMSTHIGSQFGDHTDDYVGAGMHNINHYVHPLHRGQVAAPSPAQAWATSLGIRYISASNKEEFENNVAEFIASEGDAPVLFECFTTPANEDVAHEMIMHIDRHVSMKGQLKSLAKKVLPKETVSAIKKVIK